MSPIKQRIIGISGCRLATGDASYQLQDGTTTSAVAITVSLLCAEPCLRRWSEAVAISTEEAEAKGYRLVRTYDAALGHGLI